MDLYQIWGRVSDTIITNNWIFVFAAIAITLWTLKRTEPGQKTIRFFLLGDRKADVAMTVLTLIIIIGMFVINIFRNGAIAILFDFIFSLFMFATVIRYDPPEKYAECRRRYREEQKERKTCRMSDR